MTNFNVMAELGILISGATVQNITPEKAIVSSFESVTNDLGGLMLIHTWLINNHDLIHTESLINELEAKPEMLKFVSGALFATGQKRFNKIYNLADNSKQVPPLGNLLSFAVSIGQSAPMECYSRFGLTITSFKLESPRKFKTREHMVQNNPFFFCRSLFGINWRADVAACFLINLEKNPTTIRNFLNCSYETSYRNYKELSKIGWNSNIRNAFN